jgi:hypothetical protein
MSYSPYCHIKWRSLLPFGIVEEFSRKAPVKRPMSGQFLPHFGNTPEKRHAVSLEFDVIETAARM